ncbi:hypothetical protein [Vibrio vulnificus YJ016]|uniref:Uncharacterized protein n=1 Tax=Vibrio vulnificus (strain YJ016) TaxID=196600 RepID=Q7MHW1_VIBVY|nr:hypothetical protein [Vibrio vulnificus YJ016]
MRFLVVVFLLSFDFFSWVMSVTVFWFYWLLGEWQDRQAKHA